MRDGMRNAELLGQKQRQGQQGVQGNRAKFHVVDVAKRLAKYPLLDIRQWAIVATELQLLRDYKEEIAILRTDLLFLSTTLSTDDSTKIMQQTQQVSTFDAEPDRRKS